MLNVNKIFTTLVSVSVESPFTFVRGFFDKRYLFPKKTGRIHEQTTNKPKRRVEELTVLDAKKIRWFADFLVDLCFAMDCKLVLFCSVFIVMGTSETLAPAMGIQNYKLHLSKINFEIFFPLSLIVFSFQSS